MGDNRLLYLSGAPRVTTHPSCAEPGPRSHILGVLAGLRSCGWDARILIVGDMLRTGRGTTDGGRQKSTLRLLVNDALRLACAAVFGPFALLRSHGVRFSYERLGLMQALGFWPRLRGIPWVLETQSVCSREAEQTRRATALGFVASWIERAAYRRCDLVVAVSEAVRDEVCRFSGIRPDKVLVLPNGVDCVAIQPGAQKTSRRNTLRVGFVGTVLSWQNLPALIRAIHELRKEGADIELAIAGDGGGIDECRLLVRELCLDDAVSFAGRIPHAEVSRFLDQIDIGYSGQRPDTSGAMYHSPLKLYEYMAAGIPFIASRFPDAVHASAGICDDFLFDPSVPRSLCDRLRAAWIQRDSLPSRGAALRRIVVAEHSWDQRVAVLLSELASRHLIPAP